MAEVMKTKTCCVCKKTKSLGSFALRKQNKDGRESSCKLCGKEYRRKYKKENKEHIYFKEKERQYGITVEEYNGLLKEQEGVCAICGNINRHERSLFIDHDHNTLEVRGLLCRNCNVVLGCAHDNPALLRRAAEYLEG